MTNLNHSVLNIHNDNQRILDDNNNDDNSILDNDDNDPSVHNDNVTMQGQTLTRQDFWST